MSPEAPIQRVYPDTHTWRDGASLCFYDPPPHLNARALEIAQECIPDILGTGYALALSRLHTAIVRGMDAAMPRKPKP